MYLFQLCMRDVSSHGWFNPKLLKVNSFIWWWWELLQHLIKHLGITFHPLVFVPSSYARYHRNYHHSVSHLHLCVGEKTVKRRMGMLYMLRDEHRLLYRKQGLITSCSSWKDWQRHRKKLLCGCEAHLLRPAFDFSSTVPWPGAVALSSSTFGRIQKAESMTWPWWQRFLWQEWWGCKILAWQVAPCQKRESFMLEIRPKVDGTAPRMATKSCLNSDRLASGNSSELSRITSLILHQWLM